MKNIDAVAALAAIGQENRLDVFRLLVQAGPEGMLAGGVAAALLGFLPRTAARARPKSARQPTFREIIAISALSPKAKTNVRMGQKRTLSNYHCPSHYGKVP
jgi:hypothetical protein